METLSHILASFDIFQVILSAFPQIFKPLIHAFQSMFGLIGQLAGKEFSAHPGLFSGTIIFLLGYITWSGISRLKRAYIATRSGRAKQTI